ncbi:hypothetical protein FGADI_11472 [Fusarium gaditjirri]|uniref:BZIP domain-containing protein n=1 Tax=Fusarium gaditjirri TaxID=282569 RepID=A0A8H4SV01_9HYPO|nr:hypothetical protein FGADI_11472 [Fusarium gaditjirri]
MYHETKTSTAKARQLKKRENDRKAQRSSRERTKSRIVQLESMVDMLKQANSNTQIAALMDKLSKVTKERDNLLQVLDSLGSIIRRHLGNWTTSELPSDTISNPSQYADIAQSTPAERIVPITTQRLTPETSNSIILEPPINSTLPDTFAYDGWNYTFNNFILASAENGLISTWPLADIHTPL